MEATITRTSSGIEVEKVREYIHRWTIRLIFQVGKHNISASTGGQNSSVRSAKWQAKMGNWHAKKYLDDQTNGTIVSQNILGLPKQILMALQIFSNGTLFFSYFMPCSISLSCSSLHFFRKIELSLTVKLTMLLKLLRLLFF